ncbi:hypothetical protein K440DRAFT_613447, partial [Wilcoxina mikolae CBS 423.85]
MRTTSSVGIALLATLQHAMIAAGSDCWLPSATVYDNSATTANPSQITCAPAIRLQKRATSVSNTLLEGICTEPLYHVENTGWKFVVPWLGCDQLRLQCCASGFASYAFTVGTHSPTGSIKDFRVTACPDGFTLGTLSTLPAGVEGICCPPDLTPLETYGGDWAGNAMCKRSMNSQELSIQRNGGWTAAIGGSVDWTAVTGSVQDRFQSRFVALGYYKESQATAASTTTTTPEATSTSSVAINQAVSSSKPGLPSAAVAGIAVGALVVGCLIGVGVLYFWFRRRRNDGDSRYVDDSRYADDSRYVGGYSQTQLAPAPVSEVPVTVLVSEMEGDGAR